MEPLGTSSPPRGRSRTRTRGRCSRAPSAVTTSKPRSFSSGWPSRRPRRPRWAPRPARDRARRAISTVSPLNRVPLVGVLGDDEPRRTSSVYSARALDLEAPALQRPLGAVGVLAHPVADRDRPTALADDEVDDAPGRSVVPTFGSLPMTCPRARSRRTPRRLPERHVALSRSRPGPGPRSGRGAWARRSAPCRGRRRRPRCRRRAPGRRRPGRR